MVRYLLFGIAAVYTVLIAYLSLINLADTPVSQMEVSDKLLHGGAYFVLVILWSAGLVSGRQKIQFLKRLFFICLSCIAFGIFIEVLQDRMTSYRSFDYFDMLANSFGAVAAGFLLLLLKKSINRVKK